MTRFANIVLDGRSGIGAVDRDSVVPMWDAAPELAGATLAQALATHGAAALADLADACPVRVPASRVAWRPPMDAASKIICVGLNFRDHAAEAKLLIPAHPSLFVRFASSLVGHEEPIIAPNVSEQFDYEGELVAVIGRAGRRIPEHAAMDHVLGYTIMAENSVRDWQRHASQATAGKNFAASGAVGPWCVTRDVFAPDTTFRIITRVNGTVVQDGDTAQFIFSLPHVVAYVSTFTELLPGDLIALGTPSGVGMARTPPLWLRPGDLLEVEVSGIGTLRNRVVSDPAAGPVADTAQPERSQGQ